MNAKLELEALTKEYESLNEKLVDLMDKAFDHFIETQENSDDIDNEIAEVRKQIDTNYNKMKVAAVAAGYILESTEW